MNENRVVPLRQPDEIDDPLTGILRSGRGGSFSRRWRRSLPPSWPGMPISSCRMGAGALSGTGMIPCARSRRASGQSRCQSRKSARSRGDDEGRAHPLFVDDPAEIGAANEEPRRSSAGSLSARPFHRRLSGGAGGFAWQRP
jgi:hypothetical protein